MHEQRGLGECSLQKTKNKKQKEKEKDTDRQTDRRTQTQTQTQTQTHTDTDKNSSYLDDRLAKEAVGTNAVEAQASLLGHVGNALLILHVCNNHSEGSPQFAVQFVQLFLSGQANE